MSFVGKGAEKLGRRDALVREPAGPDAQIVGREVVVARRLREVRARRPGTPSATRR